MMPLSICLLAIVSFHFMEMILFPSSLAEVIIDHELRLLLHSYLLIPVNLLNRLTLSAKYELLVPAVSSGCGSGSSGAGQQVRRIPPYDSRAETSPGDDMETGLTPPRCIYPWGLIIRHIRANLEDCDTQWKQSVMSNAIYPDRVLCARVRCGVSFCRHLYEANTHSHRSFPQHCTLVPSAWFHERVPTDKIHMWECSVQCARLLLYLNMSFQKLHICVNPI